MSNRKLFLIGCLFLGGLFNYSYAISPVLDENDSTEFFELDDIDAHKDFVSTKSFVRDTVDIYSNPACELYNYSWTSERLNPYRIKIDSLPDSVFINCSDFVYPLRSNHVTSNFGMRKYRYHYGIDLGVKIGDTIRATFGGKVRIVDYERKGYGHYLVIRHNNGLETVYAHLLEVLVNVNQTVKAGDIIALGGNTGHSTGPHLHYEIRFLGNAFNPTKLIDFQTKKLHKKDYYITKKDTYSHAKELKAMAQARYHKVRPGDNLSKIARRYGVTVKQLCKLNKISPNSILRVGKKIRYK
ncbi:MAG: peptidoglycan DD-metalloendopeptidase family protein [Prevotellaceae bacterium]|nr:peptidoglycan DD-metalloendopeptidase family protein [Prevotellaceae bacterium]